MAKTGILYFEAVGVICPHCGESVKMPKNPFERKRS